MKLFFKKFLNFFLGFLVFVLVSVGSFPFFETPFFHLVRFLLVYFLKHGFFQFKQFFIIIESSIICNFTILLVILGNFFRIAFVFFKIFEQFHLMLYRLSLLNFVITRENVFEINFL